MNLLASFFAVLIVAAGTGALFLVAGIVGSTMIEGFVNNESIRFFTYVGCVIGGGFGFVGVWAYERKKDGQG